MVGEIITYPGKVSHVQMCHLFGGWDVPLKLLSGVRTTSRSLEKGRFLPSCSDISKGERDQFPGLVENLLRFPDMTDGTGKCANILYPETNPMQVNTPVPRIVSD